MVVAPAEGKSLRRRASGRDRRGRNLRRLAIGCARLPRPRPEPAAPAAAFEGRSSTGPMGVARWSVLRDAKLPLCSSERAGALVEVERRLAVFLGVAR